MINNMGPASEYPCHDSTYPLCYSAYPLQKDSSCEKRFDNSTVFKMLLILPNWQISTDQTRNHVILKVRLVNIPSMLA